MINKTKSRIVTASVVALLALSGFVYMYLDAQGVYSQILEVSSTLGGIQEEKFRKDTVMDLMSRTGNERTAVLSYFVPADGVVDFIEQVEALGRTTGGEVDVESVKTKPVDAEKNTEKLELVISVVGSWKENLEFLAKLEQFPYKTEISRMLIEVGGGKKGVWRSEYIMSVYKLK